MRRPLDQKCHGEFTQRKEKEGNEICRITATIMEFDELLVKIRNNYETHSDRDMHECKIQK